MMTLDEARAVVDDLIAETWPKLSAVQTLSTLAAEALQARGETALAREFSDIAERIAVLKAAQS